MRFFELTNPEYESDWAYMRQNPAEDDSQYCVPRIIVDGEACGTLERFPVIDIPEERMQCFRGCQFIEEEEWFELLPKWMEILGLQREQIQPGMAVGPLSIVLRAPILHDFTSVGCGLMAIAERVKRALENANATGLLLPRAKMKWAKKVPDEKQVPNVLYDLMVTGRVAVHGRDEREYVYRNGIKIDCLPGKGSFDIHEELIDLSSWQGEDFVSPTLNSNFVIVSERIKNLFEEHGLTNYQCIPVRSK